MRALSTDELVTIAEKRGLTYQAPAEEKTEGRRVVKTVLSREIAMSQEDAFSTFADPQAHVRYFTIIKGSTPLIPLEGALGPNEYIVLEHVQEADLPPRMMIVKYTLLPPSTIIKEAITDPFNKSDFVVMDKKKGRVRLQFDRTDRKTTQVTCDSTFETNDGPVFVRGFIDHVWMNFFERLLVETGEIKPDQMLTKA